MRHDIKFWLEQANDDIEVAQSNFSNKQYYAAAFFV